MRADRAFRNLLLCAALAASALAVPLLITLFPGPLHHLLHSYDGFAQACAAALYRLGVELPPLGTLVLAIAGATTTAGLVAFVRVSLRTSASLRARRVVAVPPAVALAAASVGISTHISCIEEARPLAYCAGLIWPRVWISTGAAEALGRDELEAVLLHEAYHLRHRDPLRVFVALVLERTFFGFPMVRALGARFAVAKELDADRSVLEAQRSAAPLAGALFALGRSDQSFPRQGLALGAWSASNARVDQLCGTPEELLLPSVPPGSRLVTTLALAVLLLLAGGQAARADLLPAGVVEAITATSTEIHGCPLPAEAILF